MLEALFRRCKQYYIVRRRQTADPLASNSDNLVDSTVPIYQIHMDQEEWWKHTSSSGSNTHVEGLWFNSADTDTNVWEGTQWLDGQ